jgi:hypothetical protein
MAVTKSDRTLARVILLSIAIVASITSLVIVSVYVPFGWILPAVAFIAFVFLLIYKGFIDKVVN